MSNRTDKILPQYQEMASRGCSVESILHCMRNDGCTKVESILMVRKIRNVSLSEAKRLVHLSAAWSDVRERDDAFHDEVWDALNR